MFRWGEWLARLSARVEAPTWCLIVAIYGGWLALTFWWHALPAWLALPAAAWICAWHMSLQHELMHGHPTRHQPINAALAWPPLTLWLPYPIYRDSHLRHHANAHLTDPLEDPESTYMPAQAWAEAGRARRWLHVACNTLLGRLLLGPAWTIAQFWASQALRFREAGAWRLWLGHAAAAGAVLAWVWGVCRIDPLIYGLCFVYPATSLTLLRSLAEHRAACLPEDRTAVVEHAGLLGLLYLNNNLHVLHHDRPGLPWYALPAAWRQARPAWLRARQGPIYHGYLEVARRYALRPHHPGPYPTPP